MLLSYYFIIFAKNIYTMDEIKYLPTDYFSNKSVIETPWSVDPELIEISGYRPILRNRVISTEENSNDITTDPTKETKSKQETYTKPKQETYTKPVQETVQAKTVSTQMPQNVVKPKQQINAQEVVEPKEGKIYTNSQDFVRDMTAAYTKALTAKGISTDYAKMLVAQDALESNWGKSSLSKDFNFGGIKAVEGTPFVEKETKEHDPKKGMYTTKAKFRKFNSLDDYVNYKINLLNGKRYQAFTGDPSQFYHRVKAGGYATDPKYVEKLMKIYNNPIFSAKQGGSLPSRIDVLVEKFNKQFNK